MYFNAERNRMMYSLVLMATIVAGLLSRIFNDWLPSLLSLYFSDVLWGFMVFVTLALVFKKKSTLQIVIYAVVISFGIEVSLLIDHPILNDLKETTLGGLILEDGFLGTDLICFSVGIIVGFILEMLIKRKSKMKW